MIVELCCRHYGVHHPVKRIKIEGNVSDFVRKTNTNDRYYVNEVKLLKNVKKGFLPVPSTEILLMIENFPADGSTTGISNLKLFRCWSKYFDCYSLILRRK